MATTNTITGLLSRINDAANLIWNKASDMALQLPAGSYWDSNSKSDKTITGINSITGTNSPEAQYKIDSNGSTETYNFGIDAVAQAINNINSKEYLGQNSDGIYISRDLMLPNKLLLLINAKTTIKIPVGYNKNAFEITAQSIGELLNNTSAISKYLYKDKTAYIKNAAGEHELITGTLGTVYLNAALGEFNENKINLNNKTLKVSVNNDATSEFLDTNIVYRNPEELVTDSTRVAQLGTYTNNSKDYVKVNLARGYYDKNILTDIPYIGTRLEKTVEVTRTTSGENTTIIANSLAIPAGYYKEGLVIKPYFIDFGENNDYVLNITSFELSSRDKLTSNNGMINFSPGTYKGGPFDYFDHVAIPEAEISLDRGLLTISKSGWINSGILGDGYEYLTPDLIIVSNAWDSERNVITNNQFNIQVAPGYYSATYVNKEFTIKPGSHNLSVVFSYNNNKFGGSDAITSGIITIGNQYGKINDTIVSGWINGNGSEGVNTYYKIQDWTRIDSTVNTDDYYTIGTAGWISPNDSRSGYEGFKYIGNALNSGGTYNPINAAKNLVIKAGTVLTNDLSVDKVSVGEAEYTITDTDLANADGNKEVTKFSVAASSGYMSKITIDMIEILKELQKI